MKTALVTTTINVPSVFSLYRRFDPSASVRFFVAIDKKTPRGIRQFLDNLGNCECIEATDYKCDQIIGWNTDARRNFATLEALKWGAEILVFVDDDNIVVSPNFFHSIHDTIEHSFSGLQASGRWFDVGSLMYPEGEPQLSVRQRGIPPDQFSLCTWRPAVDAKVGVVSATILGQPDISAVDRIGRINPVVHQVAEVLREGFVLDPAVSRTVFNTQATAVVRELIPAMFIWPGSGTGMGAGRNSDIFASLICQRVMRDRGYHVHFGPPMVFQERNEHNFLTDVRGELWAMEHIVRFAEWLDLIDIPKIIQGPVLPTVRAIYQHMAKLDWMPPIVSECGLVFCEDVERVL